MAVASVAQAVLIALRSDTKDRVTKAWTATRSETTCDWRRNTCSGVTAPEAVLADTAVSTAVAKALSVASLTEADDEADGETIVIVAPGIKRTVVGFEATNDCVNFDVPAAVVVVVLAGHALTLEAADAEAVF